MAREFDRVAHRYDLLAALNPGYRKHLRWSAARLQAPPGARVLDLCCGTGLSTEAIARQVPGAEVTAMDASPAMLAHARKKPALSGVRFVEGDAAAPARAGADGPFEAVLMAYGIRNVRDPDRCLANLYRLLVPGGVVLFHEYSIGESRTRRAVWNAVSLGIIFPLAAVTTGSLDLFRYLRRSVLAFDGVAAFKARLRTAGFTEVEALPMDGWQRGIVHSFRARRPI